MKPDISEKEKKVYVTLYKKDAPSYAMILLATLLEFVYVVSILDVMPVTFMMGVAVIVNIFLLFLLFTCAVKVNVYEIPWAAVSLIVGGYMLLRQFVLVPFVLQPYDREQIILVANLAGTALLFAAGQKLQTTPAAEAAGTSEPVNDGGIQMGKIQFQNVNKVYPNGFHAIHDFNLDVDDGEFIVFVGPSGCGKSTVLRMLAGGDHLRQAAVGRQGDQQPSSSGAGYCHRISGLRAVRQFVGVRQCGYQHEGAAPEGHGHL